MRFRMFISTCCFSLLVSIAQAGEENQHLDIYFIDVEGGAATLIVTPAGESILIDSGYPDNNGRDRDRILETVKLANLDHIDHAVVSHWHVDHYGNHATLSSLIPIHNFWDRGIPDALQEDKNFDTRIADYRAATQNQSNTLRAGDHFELDSNGTPLSVTVLTASRNVIPNSGEPNPFASESEDRPRDESDNACSLSLLFEFGDFRFLCCGDLTWEIEAKLMTPNNPVGTVDLFMVTHHGLPTSNNPVLVKALDPTVAVMCNGPTKGGHPDSIATLQSCQSLEHLYQLHRNVKLDADAQTPAEFIANSEPTENCDGIGVKASVRPDGSSYTVQIGNDGKLTEYKTRKR
ncbi:MBL fold metallo-hydrolase [Thalassoglobus sp. JC818]|uniref:ComEC/Rec2 family competence protein n=1 Tax=Thalassoglobus sp. JC818 TaxID=3232136 RepID=UPI003457D362